ncbi:hypothetical protein, partial [Pseudomonas sp. CCC2.2]|uniref:hypothetical protein n=1 Tax=Pseudomonas sp. CCC2.2 TaxID=3048605 RepID=UPI002B23E1C3
MCLNFALVFVFTRGVFGVYFLFFAVLGGFIVRVGRLDDGGQGVERIFAGLKGHAVFYFYF